MSNLFDERDELANEDAFGLTEADYEERANVFAAMDAAEDEFAPEDDLDGDFDYSDDDYGEVDYGFDDGLSEFMEGYSENW